MTKKELVLGKYSNQFSWFVGDEPIMINLFSDWYCLPAGRQAWEFGNYFLRILQERTKETVRATNIPDIEKRKKRRISLSFINAYLLSIIPT